MGVSATHQNEVLGDRNDWRAGALHHTHYARSAEARQNDTPGEPGVSSQASGEISGWWRAADSSACCPA